MVDIKTTIKAICRTYPGGQKAMAVQLGMTYDAFRNHLDQKCASRFFTLAEIERMEDVSGTSLLAEYHAARRGNYWLISPFWSRSTTWSCTNKACGSWSPMVSWRKPKWRLLQTV
ncbi:hypothetical protein O0544_17435 [Edwardsiella anguillarum]|nr:hypothetical protein [Edwardsiella anguillarum]